MAKLPEIQYGPVEAPGKERMQLTAAARGAVDVVTEGIALYGREVVKTRTMRATADLAEGLADLEVKLTSKPSLSAAAVRQELGADVESLPPEVKKRLTQPALDKSSGATVDVDREEIPAWEVSGAVYDLRAKRILEAASKDIPGGWKSSFELAAAHDVLARKSRIAQVQARNFAQNERALQAQEVERLVRAGEFDSAQAATQAGGLWTPAERDKLSGIIEHGRQQQPFEDLVLRGIHGTADVVEAGKLIGRLESGEGLDQLDDKERTERKREIERHVAEYERRAKYAVEHAFDAQDAVAQDAIVNALVQARGRPLPFSLVPRSGDASPKMREHLYNVLEGTQKGETVKTDPQVYDVLSRLARDDPKAFVDHDVLQYLAAGRLSMEHFTRFSDLQRTLKAEGPGPKYSSFVGPQEETDRLLLDQGVQVRGANISEKDQRIRGYVHSVVDGELFRATARNQGKPLDLDERNKLIRSTVAREFTAKPWYRLGGREVRGAAIDPVAPGGSLARTATRLGLSTDAEDLAALSGEFEGVVPAIAAGWRRATPKSLRQDDALGIFELMRREQRRIDAALLAQGKAVDEANRAAVATQLYLAGMR